jgi:hypothetical protein
MSVILSQTFCCKRCRLLAPIGFSAITPDGLLCLYCTHPTTEQQRAREADAWIAGVLCEDEDEDTASEDENSADDDDDEKARAGLQPATSSKK